MSYKIIITFLLIINSENYITSEIYLYSNKQMCKKDEYFNTQLFKCLKCDSDKYLKPSDNGLSCSCNSSSFTKVLWNRINFSPTCSSCPNKDHIIDENGLACISLNCPTKIFIGNKSQPVTCQRCGNDEIEVYTYDNGTFRSNLKCVKCSSGFRPSADKRKCAPCQLQLLIGNDLQRTCVCPNKTHILEEDVCIPKTIYGNLWGENIHAFRNYTYDSQVFKKLLMSCIFYCKLHIASGCQCLGNLCALRVYSQSWLPCTMWPPEPPNALPLPKIMYEEGDAHAELYRRRPDSVFALDDPPLNLTLVTYSPDGKNVTSRTITPGWLDPCEGNPGHHQQIEPLFGRPYNSECHISLHQLMNYPEAGFLHELYLNYRDPGDDLDYMQPVPVLIENMGHRYEENADFSSWILVRRFFLADDYPNSYQAGLVRYAKSLILLVRLRPGAPGKIHPPVLLLKYGTTKWDPNHFVDVYSEVRYTSTWNLLTAIYALLITLIILGMLWSGLGAWSFSRRSGLPILNVQGLVQFLLLVCGRTADSLLFSALIGGVMARIMYHALQSNVAITIVSRSDQEENVVLGFLIAALVLKLVEVGKILHQQLTVDLFLIDWEKPRAMSCLPRPLSTAIGTSQAANEEVQGPQLPVSVWRSYLVANEWNELQVFRKIHSLGHALAVVVIAEILGLSHAHMSQTELVGFSTLLYVSLYFIQLMLRLGIYERYVNAGLMGFVDLCSLANISMLIVSLDQYGYYIHGRSPHGFADTDMRSMLLQLQREQEGRCGSRGLLRDSQQQTYTARLPSALRAYYRKMMSPLSEAGRYGRATGTRAMSDSEKIEKSVQAYRNINRFLASFIDHALRDLDYEVRERGPVERLLDAETSVTVDGGHAPKYGGVFYPDSGHAFDAVLWYGQEWTWFTVELAMFLVVVLACGNVSISAVSVAVAIQILAVLTKYLAKKNLARKTLIDNRFLI